MSYRTWTNGLSRLDIEKRSDGTVLFGVHGLNARGQRVDWGYVAAFKGADLAEIVEFITEGA